MTGDPVPDYVRAFIVAHIGTVAELEALLLLRAQRDVDWDVAAAARRLYVAESVAAEVLAQLVAYGLLVREGELYRYQPCNDSLRRSVDGLAEAYSRYLIPVTKIVHNNPLRLRRFADAFRFRKD